MGRVYALHDGIAPEVADAILEHYLPRGAEDRRSACDLGSRRPVDEDRDAVADDLRVDEAQRLLVARLAEEALA